MDDMELGDFVAATLLQIQRGVELAVRARPAGPGAIAPVLDPARPGAAEKVEFDLAVGGGQRADGRPTLKVLGTGAGGGSRVRFSIPIVPAGQEMKQPPAPVKGGARR